MPPPHLPVEVLHPQFLAAFRMRPEFLGTAQKMAVPAHPQRHPGPPAHLLHPRKHPVLPWLHTHHFLHLPATQKRRQFLPQRPRILRIFQFPVMHPPARRPQPVPEMPHGRQKQHNPLPMRPHLRRLCLHFRHPHLITPRIPPVEHSRVLVELIPENHQQPPYS